MSRKGPEFEREICDRLSFWWTGDDSTRVFWRTSNSGGMATVRDKKGTKRSRHHSDVCAIDLVGLPLTELLTIELKRGYTRYSPFDMMDKEGDAEQLFEKWIEKAEKDSAAARTMSWIIIFRRNRRKSFVMMPTPVWAICCGDRDPYPRCCLSFWGRTDLFLISLEDFLQSLTKEVVIKRLDQWKEGRGGDDDRTGPSNDYSD